jgi:hypothetical protein
MKPAARNVYSELKMKTRGDYYNHNQKMNVQAVSSKKSEIATMISGFSEFSF